MLVVPLLCGTLLPTFAGTTEQQLLQLKEDPKIPLFVALPYVYAWHVCRASKHSACMQRELTTESSRPRPWQGQPKLTWLIKVTTISKGLIRTMASSESVALFMEFLVQKTLTHLVNGLHALLKNDVALTPCPIAFYIC
mmetsp:Transcript_61214/g.121224  ORF Transcript_61214/g.121224 Transcript_61214/m.121224 type:complete len:139 (-) Transcript_61214:572-988(-)